MSAGLFAPVYNGESTTALMVKIFSYKVFDGSAKSQILYLNFSVVAYADAYGDSDDRLRTSSCDASRYTESGQRV